LIRRPDRKKKKINCAGQEQPLEQAWKNFNHWMSVTQLRDGGEKIV
jgi:hypothetical protein